MPLTAAQKLVLFSPNYSNKLRALFGSSIVSYLPLWEGAGSVAADIGGRGLNGAYTAVTLGQPGIGDGRTAASFDGSTSYVNWYSAGLASGLTSPGEIVLVTWIKASAAGVWTDAAVRRLAFLQADSGNFFTFTRTATNNTIEAYYQSGSGATFQAVTTTSSLVWICLMMTVSRTNSLCRFYLNGALAAEATPSLSAWSGSLATVLIGAQSTVPVRVWSGLQAHTLLACGAGIPALANANAALIATVP